MKDALPAAGDQKVRWCSSPRRVSDPCPLCGNQTANEVVLNALHWRNERGYVEFAACAGCGSLFCIDAERVNASYPDDAAQLHDPNFILLLHHYLELLDGLDWKATLLDQISVAEGTSVLEVGCNLGVTIDYCRSGLGAEVIGLEPSVYGLGGANMLGLPILQQYLDDAEELKGRRFDLAIATEVIEHTPDPRAFLSSIRTHLTPRGQLLFTTPRAEGITRDKPLGQLAAMLSAGAHNFIFSSRALAQVIRDSGFRHHHLWPSEVSLVSLVAEHEPITLRPARPVKESMAGYYQKRLARPTADPRVELAYAIRAYEWGMQLDSVDPAVDALPARIDVLLSRHFGVTVRQPLEIVARVRRATDLFSFGRSIPYSLPIYLHTYARRITRSEPGRAYELAALGALLCLYGMRADPQNLSIYYHVLPKFDRFRGLEAMWRTTPTGRELLRELDQLEFHTSRFAMAPLNKLGAQLRRTRKQLAEAYVCARQTGFWQSLSKRPSSNDSPTSPIA